MRTKREQVQAHRFVIRRIVSGMIQGNPEALEFPMRRTGGSILGGLAIAVLVFAGFWVVGALFGSADWRDKPEGAIIIDEDSGAQYVWANQRLHPVENITSAWLFLEKGLDTPTYQVSTADLDDVPRGGGFGIEDAPDAIAPSDKLVTLPWQVCSGPNKLNNKNQDSFITLDAPAASDRLKRDAQLVKSGDEYSLIWNDLRFPVPSPEQLPVVSLDAADAVEVHPVLIAGIKEGPAFAKPEIPGAGDKNDDVIDGAENGDLFELGGDTYVLTSRGFEKLTEVAQLLLTEGETADVEPLTNAELDEVGTTGDDRVVSPQWPRTRGALGDPPLSETGFICAVYDSQKTGDVGVATYKSTDPPDPIADPSSTTVEKEEDDVSTADHVWMPPGHGALVRASGSDAAEDGTLYLLMGDYRYALTDEAAKRLGYGDVKPTKVPAQLVNLVPSGPALDTDEVLRQYSEIADTDTE